MKLILSLAAALAAAALTCPRLHAQVDAVTDPDAAKLLEDVSNHPAMASGDIQVDQATAAEIQKQAEIAIIQQRIDAAKEADRAASFEPQNSVEDAEPPTALETAAGLRDSVRARQEQVIRNNQPTIDADTRTERVRAASQLTQDELETLSPTDADPAREIDSVNSQPEPDADQQAETSEAQPEPDADQAETSEAQPEPDANQAETTSYPYHHGP